MPSNSESVSRGITVHETTHPPQGKLMDADATHTRRFSQLRWKLALSYTAVTVGALLAVALVIIIASAVILVAMTNSGSLPVRLVDTAKVEYAPSLRPYLEDSPSDVEGIAAWLGRCERTTSRCCG